MTITGPDGPENEGAEPAIQSQDYLPRPRNSLILWREGAVRLWGPGVTLIVLINSFARGSRWQHEWLWATDTVAFSYVFLVPVCAGIASYEAGRLAAAHDLVVVSPRGSRALVGTGLSVWLVALVSIPIGILAASAAVVLRTGALAPHTRFVVLIVFAIIMGACVSGFGVELVEVGGATGSLVGLRVKPVLALWKCAFYLGGLVLLGVACAGTRSAEHYAATRVLFDWLNLHGGGGQGG